MAKDYKNSLKSLGERIKTEPVQTPIQEVRPVEAPAPAGSPKPDAHVNFWVPDSLMKRLKVYAAQNGLTIKQVGIEALEKFLSNE